MQTNKVLILFCLLLTYTIGQAHDFIPHCHHDERETEVVQEHVNEHHGHHDHQENKRNHSKDFSKACIEKSNDLLCYIICLLSETEHPVSNGPDCFYIPSTGYDLSSKLLTNHKLTAILLGLFLDSKNHTEQSYSNIDDSVTYQSPPLSYSFNRGPPAFSC